MSTSFLKDQFSNNRFALVLIGFVAIVIYSNILGNPFVFDDRSSIVENGAIRDLSGFFTQGRLFEPRAVVELTFALNYRIGGLDVYFYHLVNILIHILNGFIAYFLVKAILKKRPELLHLSNTTIFEHPDNTIHVISLFSALIFVAHPIQTQAVTYTVQRYASMAAFFYLGMMLFYTYARIVQKERSRKTNRGPGPVVLYTLSVFCGMMAFLSKQNTASLPASIILLEYLLINPVWTEWKRKLPWFALMLFLWFLFIAYVTGLFGGEADGGSLLEDVSSALKETETVSRWEYLCTQFNVLVIYIRLLFLPINQNLDYMYPFKSGFFDDFTSVAFVILTLTAGFGAWNIKKRPIIAFSIFFFFITLSVESSIIPISDALFEHRLYLPAFGFGFFVAYVVFIILSNRGPVLFLLFFLIVVGLSTASYRRNIIWQDSIVLWTDVLSKSPHNYRAHNNLGNMMMHKGLVNKAIQYYSDALTLEPNYWVTHNNLGIARVSQMKIPEAITSFDNALRLKPDYGDAHYNLGNAMSMLGKLKKAEIHYLEALRLSPHDFETHNNLAILLTRQGKTSRARAHFREAIRIKPDFLSSIDNLKKIPEGNMKQVGCKSQ